jgi:hypothetical protein
MANGTFEHALDRAQLKIEAAEVRGRALRSSSVIYRTHHILLQGQIGEAAEPASTTAYRVSEA